MMSARKGIGGYLGLEPYAGEPYHVGVALEIIKPSKSRLFGTMRGRNSDEIAGGTPPAR